MALSEAAVVGYASSSTVRSRFFDLKEGRAVIGGSLFLPLLRVVF